MGVKKLISVLFAISLLNLVKAQFAGCDYDGALQNVGSVIELNHYTSTGNCRYKVKSPIDTFVQVTCDMVSLLNNCPRQNITVSRSGIKDLRDGIPFCSSSNFAFPSIGNEVVVAFRSLVSNSGSFRCKFLAVALNNNNCDCSWNVNKKIVGGTETTPNQFTMHAGLMLKGDTETYCGSIIIRQKYALTAAHCVDYALDTGSKSDIIVGDHNIESSYDTKWAARYEVGSFYKHERYNSVTNENDIAIVVVADYIRYSPGVSPACLPYTFNGYNFTGKYLDAVGWGAIDFSAPHSPVLLRASLQVITNSKCQSQMQGTNIYDSNVCTFTPNKDTCTADSGGGLYWFASVYYPIGISSFGVECASKLPGVSMRVTSYIGWIERTIGGFFCRKT